MRTYRRFIRPKLPTGDAAPASGFAALMAERIRDKASTIAQRKAG